MNVYSSRSANEVWKHLARDLLKLKGGQGTPSRLGDTQEIIHAVVEITDPKQRWVVARRPPINPAFALAEVVWFMLGRNDTAFLANWFPDYPSYVGNDVRQYGAYGDRLRNHLGFDQLKRAYDALRNNPETRQVVLQIWSGADDFPDPNGLPRAEDIPCNLTSTVKVRDGRLEWLQTVRSNDIDRGVPYNFVQFTTLQEVIAGWLGIEVGAYVHVVSSLHWYPGLSARVEVDSDAIPAENTDRFRESFETSAVAFETVGSAMDEIVSARKKGNSPDYHKQLGLPGPYENIYVMVAADDARRHGQREVARALANRCDNDALTQMWQRWFRRRTDADHQE